MFFSFPSVHAHAQVCVGAIGGRKETLVIRWICTHVVGHIWLPIPCCWHPPPPRAPPPSRPCLFLNLMGRCKGSYPKDLQLMSHHWGHDT
jgi:hypothetical protein